jgi:hypothetical protein
MRRLTREKAKHVLAWDCRPSNSGAAGISSRQGANVAMRRVSCAKSLVMEALLFARQNPAAQIVDPATRAIVEKLYCSNLAAGSESASGPAPLSAGPNSCGKARHLFCRISPCAR